MTYSENVNVRRNWEVCPRGNSTPQWSSLYASINKYGDIILNRTAFERLGSPAEVLLLFDKERDTIGIKPVEEGAEKDAFAVRPRGKYGGCRIRGNRLIREFALTINKTRIFDRCQLDRHGVLILDLRYSKPFGGKESYEF